MEETGTPMFRLYNKLKSTKKPHLEVSTKIYMVGLLKGFELAKGKLEPCAHAKQDLCSP